MKADNTPEGAPAPRRRPRYKGTHPTKFDQRYKELEPDKYPDMQDHVRSRGSTPAGTHIPIMLEKVMEHLQPQPGHIVLDGTLGYGGHAEEFLRRIGPTGRLIGLDVDGDQLERTRERLITALPDANMTLVHSNFAGIDKCLKYVPPDPTGISAFDVIFVDLGVSSMQIDDPTRGFSYKHDGPLDMRMDARIKRTAADWLALSTRDQLSQALLDNADEPDHDRIAGAIVHQRTTHPITRTRQLVELICKAKQIDLRRWKQQRRLHPSLPRRGQGRSERDSAHPVGGRESSDAGSGRSPSRPESETIHPAARTFQALRILVNDELSCLSQLLRTAPYCLRSGGRIGIITFHSGEDRLVKHNFRDNLQTGLYAEIAEEVIRPTPQERRANPRSTAAKLRWAQKT